MVAVLLVDWIEAREAASPNAPKGERALADPGRYRTSIGHWARFLDADRKLGHATRAHTVADIAAPAAQARFVAWRQAAGVSGHTISRDLAALRAALGWAWRKQRIPFAPHISDVGHKPGPKDLVYTPQQIAALLEAAWRLPERRHVHLFVIVVLSTVFRGEAVLEADAGQVRDGIFDSNAPGRPQTSKRRSMVPVVPTLAPWLNGARGKLIAYRVARSERPSKVARVGSAPVERATLSIKTAFRACLVEAGIVDARARALGSPNTLRHTVITELHRRGVPEAQIDLAAGHAGTGTGKRNYRHLRPGHMAEFVAAIEAMWAEIGRHTSVHLRYQRDTNVIELAGARASARGENA